MPGGVGAAISEAPVLQTVTSGTPASPSDEPEQLEMPPATAARPGHRRQPSAGRTAPVKRSGSCQKVAKVTDILFVGTAWHDAADDGVVEVKAQDVTVRERHDSHPEFSPNRHRTSEVVANVDRMLGWADNTKLGITSIPRTDIAACRPKGFQKLGSRMPFQVPTCKEDLTTDWCTRCFRYRGYLTAAESVTKIDIKPIGAGEGEFSDLALMTITEVTGGDAPTLPRSMIAKFSPPSVKGIELKLVFGTEAHMYNDCSCEGMALIRPEAVYVGAELNRFYKNKYMFLIGNCNPPSKPAKMFKRVDGCDSVPHLMIAMRGLARLHARWWNFPAPNKAPLDFAYDPSHGGGPLPKLPVWLSRTVSVMIIKTGLKALPHLYMDTKGMAGAPAFGGEFRELLSQLRPAIRRKRLAVARELVRPPLTLCHGDAHLENVFFAEHFEGGCMFIDFGLTAFGQALGDVAMVVAAGMRPDVRRAHELDLVMHYHRCLLEFGVQGYTWDQCWKDFEFQIFRPFFSLLTIAPSLARQRHKRSGMFSEHRSEGDQKLYDMYKEINLRIASALMDHKFVERVDEMDYTANAFCRPCC